MIFLPSTESTNKYAMERIADGMAEHGAVIWTKHQLSGRGQRGKAWEDEPGKSVLMSIVLGNRLEELDIFELSAMVAVAVHRIIAQLIPEHAVEIKWPNDIYVDQKKVCGILIENVFRGHKWQYAVVGIGINVLQENFAENYVACSLYSASGLRFSLERIIEAVAKEVLESFEEILEQKTKPWTFYNEVLFKKNQLVQFEDLGTRQIFEGEVLRVDEQGRLHLRVGGAINAIAHGSVRWILA